MASSRPPIQLSHEEAFQKLLRALRLAKGLTQEQLAEKAGLGSVHISFLENGKRYPSVRALFQIFGALGTNPSTIFEVIEWSSQTAVPTDVRVSDLKKLLLKPPQGKRPRKTEPDKGTRSKRTS